MTTVTRLCIFGASVSVMTWCEFCVTKYKKNIRQQVIGSQGSSIPSAGVNIRIRFVKQQNWLVPNLIVP